MDHSNTEHDEMRYQHRGYAKYVDIARLFGWESLKSFSHQEHLDYMTGATSPGSSLHKVDSRTLRLSIAAGVDLTPLIHFWGIHPTDESALKEQIQAFALSPSQKVCRLLVRYASLVPMDNTAFNAHYEEVWPGRPTDSRSCPSPLYGCGWYNEWRDTCWNEAHAKAAVSAVNALLKKYFNGACQPTTTTTTTMPAPRNRKDCRKIKDRKARRKGGKKSRKNPDNGRHLQETSGDAATGTTASSTTLALPVDHLLVLV